MNRQEYNNIIAYQRSRFDINVRHLNNQTPRTLLYGYTCDRQTWHVYLDYDMMIHLVVYSYPNILRNYSDETALTIHSCVPNKRLYPEACDYEYCVYLYQCGAYLSFTNFNPQRERAQFYGKRLFELK